MDYFNMFFAFMIPGILAGAALTYGVARRKGGK